MKRLRGWLLRFGGLFRRERRERELAAEMESHLQMHIEDNLRAGMSAEEARRQALIKLGGVEQTKEMVRERRGLPTLEVLLQDLRFGARMLRKSPGFTVVAILTLALGIGANAAIFSVVNGVLLRPLPFPRADQIFLIYEALPGFSLNLPFNAPDFRAFSERQRAFESLAIYSNQRYELSGTGAPERIDAARTSAALFPLLGIEPILGRTFTSDEDQPGHSVLVLSYGLWQRRYGADPNILGRTILLDRQSYTVIGIMPRSFQFPIRGERWNGDPAQLWVPLSFTSSELQAWGMEYNHTLLGRLKPGVTLAQAQNDAARVIAEVEKLYPAKLVAFFRGRHLGAKILPYGREIVGGVRTSLLVLLVAAGLVLLIACANVANLVLARACGRQKEMAIRAALGAARSRLLQQMLLESLLLGITAGTAGLFIGHMGTRLLIWFSPAEIPRMQGIGMDGPVLIFTLGLSLLTVVFFGLRPAIEASRIHPNQALKETGRGTTQGRARRSMQSLLIVSQTALAVILLTGAGLLLRSFANLLETDPGFRPQRALAMTIPIPLRAYSHAHDIRSFYQELLRRTAALPGVTSVGASTDLPLRAREHDGVVQIEGRELSSPIETAHSWILGDYFAAMGIMLKRGRMFTLEDRLGAPEVVIISETAARTFLPGEDPIGKRLLFGGTWHTIVGVASDVKDSAIEKPAGPHTYTPYIAMPDGAVEDPAWDGLRALHLAVRTRSDPLSAISMVRREIVSLDPQLAVADVRSMDAEIQESLAPQRFNLFLIGLFAMLAVFLASVGVYGVLSQSVAQRTHEFGVRMALGARAQDVVSMTVREGMKLAFLGAAIGSLGAFALMRLMASLLYGVSAHDPITFIVVVVAMCAVAFLACYVPARRAMRVDPMVALRYE
jgi:putative ABC transport system permease protein